MNWTQTSKTFSIDTNGVFLLKTVIEHFFFADFSSYFNSIDTFTTYIKYLIV